MGKARRRQVSEENKNNKHHEVPAVREASSPT